MADNTHIEWTDATWSGRKSASPVVHSLYHSDMRLSPGSRQPVPHIAVALGAVAFDAGRNDVRWVRLAAFRDCQDVIPRFSGCGTVGAGAVKLLKDYVGANRRNLRNATFAQMRPSLPAPSEIFIRGVAAPGILISMRSAQAGTNFVRALERAALAAPRSAHAAFYPPQDPRRTGPLASAVRAHVATSVAATPVNVEQFKRSNLPASRAALRRFQGDGARHG